MIAIDRNAIRIHELAWLVSFLAELGHERAATTITIITREYLHSMIPAVDNEQETSMMVEHQAYWIVEQAIGMAMLLGADRELDSSITIKSIVSHLFHFNLSHSLTTTKRDRKMIFQSMHETSSLYLRSATKQQDMDGCVRAASWLLFRLFLRRPRCASSARPSPSITSCFQIGCTIPCRCARVSVRD